jgi:hypothetical protein
MRPPAAVFSVMQTIALVVIVAGLAVLARSTRCGRVRVSALTTSSAA